MKNQKIKLVAIAGKAGSGKDYLLNFMCENFPQYHKIISATTRPKREGEQEGVNYYYLSNEDFATQVLNDQFLEATVFRDWCYGTQISALDPNKINMGVFNPAGVETLELDNRIDLYVIQMDVSDKTRLMRQLSREENPDVEEIIRRYTTDKMDFLDSDFTVNYNFPNEEEPFLFLRACQLNEAISDWAKLDKEKL